MRRYDIPVMRASQRSEVTLLTKKKRGSTGANSISEATVLGTRLTERRHTSVDIQRANQDAIRKEDAARNVSWKHNDKHVRRDNHINGCNGTKITNEAARRKTTASVKQFNRTDGHNQ